MLLKLKCTKFNFGWGSAPDPAWGGSLQRSDIPLGKFKGPTSKGEEGYNGEEWKVERGWKMGRSGEKEEGEGRGKKGRARRGHP